MIIQVALLWLPILYIIYIPFRAGLECILTDFCTTLIETDGLHYEWMKGLLLLHAVKHENFSDLIPPCAPTDYKFWNVVYGGLDPTEFNMRVPHDFRCKNDIEFHIHKLLPFVLLVLPLSLCMKLVSQAELTSSFISTLKLTDCFCMHG